MAGVIKKIGVLTGGGDCPGLNPVIRAIVRTSLNSGLTVVGIRNGWKGLVENETVPLGTDSISGILPKGGTILGTSRTNPYKDPKALAALKDNYGRLGLDALIAIGGEPSQERDTCAWIDEPLAIEGAHILFGCLARIAEHELQVRIRGDGRRRLGMERPDVHASMESVEEPRERRSASIHAAIIGAGAS